MNFHRVIFETNEVEIAIRKNNASWNLQVLSAAPQHHVETKDFDTYQEAETYVNKKYGLGINDFTIASEYSGDYQPGFKFVARKDYVSDDLYPDKDINFKVGDIIEIVNKDGELYFQSEKWSKRMMYSYRGKLIYSPRFMGFIHDRYFDVVIK